MAMAFVEDDLTEFERQRLAHIRRNQEELERLGLLAAPTAVATEEHDDGRAKKKRRSAPPPKSEASGDGDDADAGQPVRRSGRLQGAQPDYTGETIDTFGTTWNAITARRQHVDPGLSREERREQQEQDMQDLLEASRAWLQQVREKVLSVGLTGDGKAPSTADEWRQEAVRRWGNKVGSEEVHDWQLFVTSRLATPPPPSPLDLLQEYYCHDTWRLLVCCVLMSRVSSWKTKHDTISNFFQNWPTPSDVLDADPADLHKVLFSVGLFETRLRSLIAVTERFLQAPEFRIGLDKADKVYGCGEFCVHSYHLFCMDAAQTLNPKDSNLKSFVAWRRKHAKQEEADTAEGSDTTNDESGGKTSAQRAPDAGAATSPKKTGPNKKRKAARDEKKPVPPKKEVVDGVSDSDRKQRTSTRASKARDGTILSFFNKL
eukprot:m.304325 g.304325  ORF g.304325 m.304325 type:complete len:431 (+) comp19601_c1_seq2:26-1318(+)